jgi:hypothetical protein
MNINSTICRCHFYLWGFTPSPTSFFFFRARLNVVRAGKKRTKQENSSSAYIEIPAGRQNDRRHVLAGPPHGALNQPHHNACGAKNKFLIQMVFRSNEDEARLFAR